MILLKFLEYISTNNHNTTFILENLLIKYNFKIIDDKLQHDTRIIRLYNNNEYIDLTTNIIMDGDLNKFQYIELNYKLKNKTIKLYKFNGFY